MLNLILNNKVSSKTLFIIVIIGFVLYILLLSFLFPYTTDEIRGWSSSLGELFINLKNCFLGESPRFMNFPLIISLYFGIPFTKYLFCIINPLVQLGIVYGLFYIVKGRKLNINSWQDFFPFLLICMMYLLMTPSPSNTLFWIAGTFNYSWAFLFCLFLLCLYRKSLKQEFLKDALLVKILCLFSGFVAGMSNENTGPMMIGVSLCFIIWNKYKKVKLPQYIYYAFVGILLGVGVMFGFGGSSARLRENFLYQYFINSSIQQKMFYSLHHFNNFMKAVYFIPIITFLGLLLVGIDKKILVIKREKFILSLFTLFCGLTLAMVLFLAPMVADRAYYSAGMFCIISFLIFIELLEEVYKFKLIKYLTLIMFIYAIIILPFVIKPYFHLLKSFNDREKQIYLAKENGETTAYVDILPITKAPTQNLTIQYIDIVKYGSEQHIIGLKKWYGIYVSVEKPPQNI